MNKMLIAIFDNETAADAGMHAAPPDGNRNGGQQN